MATNDLLNVYRREIRSKHQAEAPSESVEQLREEQHQEAAEQARRAAVLRHRRRRDAAIRAVFCAVVLPAIMLGAGGVTALTAAVIAVFCGVSCWYCQIRDRSHLFAGLVIGGGTILISLVAWATGGSFSPITGFFGWLLVLVVATVISHDRRDHWTTV